MSADPVESILPTLDRLGVTLPADVDAQAIASEWVRAFSQHLLANDVSGVLSLFLEDGWWRDILAFTWDFRTLHGAAKIKKFLDDRLASTKPSACTLTEATLETPFPDLAWILVLFSFETDVGLANAVLRLVPQKDAPWKAYVLTTSLDGLKAFPENIGLRRDASLRHERWSEEREQENEFLESDPTVVVVGAGHCGLQISARLKMMGIPTLTVEKQSRIGDTWRNRYEVLCLHDTVWWYHMSYFPFPPSWPVFTPAKKMANWLEFYADVLELNVWTSSEVLSAEQREDNTWTVTVRRADGTKRKMHVQHVVLALGMGGSPKYPDVPGKEDFKGTVMHSSVYKSGRYFSGKKVVVVGTGSSGHDIADDCFEHGADVTIVQRSATYVISVDKAITSVLLTLYSETSKVPIEIADRVTNSMPLGVKKCILPRITAITNEIDKSILDGLNRVGFKTTSGPRNLGLQYIIQTNGGSYYLNVGASEKIVDGKIKVKSGSKVERLTEVGVKFEDGTVLPADVVVYATGFQPPETMIADICGKEIADRVGPMWNFDQEGELQGVWRDLGVPNIWYMYGNFAAARYNSKLLALQIAAQVGGQFGTRYAH